MCLMKCFLIDTELVNDGEINEREALEYFEHLMDENDGTQTDSIGGEF